MPDSTRLALQILLWLIYLGVLVLAVLVIADKVRPIKRLDDVPPHEGATEAYADELHAMHAELIQQDFDTHRHDLEGRQSA